jgi:uncharacterized protein YggU (UPF0235/DUF167 family)
VIDIQPHPEGALLPVRAQAGSRRSGLRGEQNGALKVAVTQVAEKGKANKAIIATLSRELGLRRSVIQLLNGKTSSNKKFVVLGVTPDQLARRIQAAIE